MARDDNVLHVRKHGSVVEVFDKLIEDLVGRDRGSIPRILVVCAGGPLRSRPDQSIGGRSSASCEASRPGVSDVLVITIGEVRGDDGDRAAIDIGIRGLLRESAEHLE